MSGKTDLTAAMLCTLQSITTCIAFGRSGVFRVSTSNNQG